MLSCSLGLNGSWRGLNSFISYFCRSSSKAEIIWFSLPICMVLVSTFESSIILSACLRWSSVSMASLAILVMPYTLIFSISLHKATHT